MPQTAPDETPADGAVVVVNYGSSALLARNLSAFAATPGVRVVVVDNLSSPDERAAITALADRHGWELVTQPNVGFGAGMNAGAARALALGSRALLLLNPDVEIDPHAAADLLAQAAADDALMIAPAVRHGDGRPAFSRGTLDLRTGALATRGPLDPDHEPWLTGACLALSAGLWERIGGFSDAYFMYWEDLELSVRANRAGARLVVRDDVVATHDVGGTQGAGKSALYRYYNCRNRLLFARRNLPRRAALRWLAGAPGYAWDVGTRGGGRGHALRHPATTLWPALRGSCAGAWLLLGRRAPGGDQRVVESRPHGVAEPRRR